MAVLFGVKKCLSCVLFAKRFLNLGQLVTSMTNFTRAKVTLIEHDKQSQKQPERGHFPQFSGGMPPDPPRKGRALHVHCPPPTYFVFENPPI